MGTTASIAIKLKKSDKNKVMSSFLNPNWKFSTNADYLYTIINSDGYILSLGQQLLDNYATYDDVLTFISCGAMSSFGIPYMEYRNGEKWENNKPWIDNKPDIEYISYCFERGKWWYISEFNNERIRTLLTQDTIDNAK